MATSATPVGPATHAHARAGCRKEGGFWFAFRLLLLLACYKVVVVYLYSIPFPLGLLYTQWLAHQEAGRGQPVVSGRIEAAVR